MESTCPTSSGTIRPCSSSPMTGKKFSSLRILRSRRRSGDSPAVGSTGTVSLASCSKSVSVRVGLKSKTYASSFIYSFPSRSFVSGFCTRKVAWK